MAIDPQNITDSLTALNDLGVNARTRKYVQGEEQWESHSLKDIRDFIDWQARRGFGARFRPIARIDDCEL